MVPTGTFKTRSSPNLPFNCLPAPGSPSSALKTFLPLKWMSVFTPSSASKITDPPQPPSPPSGPPNSILFSLRKCTAPGQPFPEITVTLT